MTQLMNEWINELMNDGGDFRTAPATLGLLNKGEATKQLFSDWLIK